MDPMSPKKGFAMVVANPPYVSRVEMQADLEPEVIRYEPHLALDGGDDGLEIIKKIRRDLPRVLCHGGYVFMEIGAGQGEMVREIFSGSDERGDVFDPVEILADYAGRDRVLFARFERKVRK